MISIALPKGRLGDETYKLFASVGYDCKAMADEGRKLVLEDAERGITYLLVKPADVAVYVERGAADIGVAGKDVLLETEPEVYELMDLGLGKCTLAVAAPEGYEENDGAALRVATKYPRVTRRYYQSRNRDIDIIKLNGSIEAAPLLGLSDVIVDIVETGGTLRENNMRVYERIAPSSARLIANIRSYKFKQWEIERMINKLSEGMKK